jgi:hypothetical protein
MNLKQWLKLEAPRALLAAAVAVTTSGCLDRPLCPGPGQKDEDCSPRTTNVIVDTLVQNAVNKIDMLFVIDNSASMADKQIILKEALPVLVQRLVNPSCIDNMGNLSAPPPANGDCPDGSAREFNPLKDINIAVITSSLGDFGAADGICTPDGTPAKSERNDNANLLGLLPRGMAVLAGRPDVTSGFLHWSATSDGDAFGATFASLVESAREFGCGYEATLEAWYRFLIDPTPYTKIVRNDCGVGATNQCIGPEVDGNGFIVPDQNLLNQRQAFLRPDSLVAIVMLTDENDCSFRTTGQSWRLTQLADPAVGGDFTAQYKSSAACETNPEDACCFSCGLVAAGQVPNGCSPDSCMEGGGVAAYPPWGSNAAGEPPSPDHPNLRCFEQKRRFGLDYLFPVQRYVNALKSVQICPGNPDLSVSNGCAPQLNPLYDDLSTSDVAAKKPPRPSSLVFLAGIVGVPWQDIALDPDPNAVLKYRKSVDPENPAEGINWSWLLGDNPMALQPTPGDILLHEQVEPRDTTAANPAPGGNAAPPTANRNANRVNGHEWDTSSDYADLQYACIFPIEPKDCPANVPDDANAQNKNCDCTVYGNDEDKNPLCQDAQNNYGLTQYYAKGYPGIRELQVLYGYQSNSIVASICPKVTDNKNSPEYGYTPAVAAIIERLKEQLVDPCLSRSLSVEQTDQGPRVQCKIVEASPMKDRVCDANRAREPVEASVAEAVLEQLRETGKCDQGIGSPKCSDLSLCTIHQILRDDGQQDCMTKEDSGTDGWCYVDEEKLDEFGLGEDARDDAAALVEKCADTEKRKLRFQGYGNPESGTFTFFACAGEAF